MPATPLLARNRRRAVADYTPAAFASRLPHRLVLLCVLCVLLRLSFPAQAQRPLGIDVSDYQGPNVNWVSVKNSGISFAWAKATEGYFSDQTNFTTYATNAKAAGVLFGAYHYARPDLHTGTVGAQTEAAHLWNVASNYMKSDGYYLQPILDIEVNLTNTAPAYTKTTLSQWVNDFCNHLVALAAASGLTIKPVVYSYVSYSSTWLDTTVTNWPLWMAQYPTSPNPQTGVPSGTSPWPAGSWKVWQYSDTGSVSGIPGACDLDVFNGTATGLTNLVVGGVFASNPPLIGSQPSSRYADQGGAITMRVAASANLPLKYQWRLNGTNIANATNTTLPLVNIQPTNAGAYTVVITNNDGKATSSVATLTVNALYAPVFTDNFEVDSSASWTLNRSSADNRATFAYDYTGFGIPSAPNSAGGTNKGLRFEANLSAGVTNALSVSPIGQGFPTNSRLHFDMWINVNGPLPGGGTGSTEAMTAGIGTAGDRVQWNLGSATADGVWFAVNGEGGASDTSAGISDFLAYNGSSLQSVASGFYTAGTGSTARGNIDVYYQNVFPGGQTPPASQQSGYPQQTGSLTVGTVGFAWRDVVVSRNGGTVEWFIDGLKIATVTGASLTASNIFVGYWDPFVSVSDNTNLSFGLVDNLRVEAPAVAPILASQPQNLWAQIGSNATFTASATGLPAPAYQWKFNGTNLAAATNTTLLLANLQGTNAGLYSVLVTNIAGTQTSSNALLSLIASTQPTMQLVGAPGSVQLNCLGETGASYALETSTNLVNWATLTNLVAPAAAFSLNPAISPDDFQRYYRLRSGP